MSSPLDAATCEGEELILFMKHYVPDDMKNLWYTTGDIVSTLNDGGIAITKNKKQLGRVIGNQNRFDLNTNNTDNKRWYVFNYEERDFDTPRDQIVEVKERQRPQIEPNYFNNLGIKFKFIGMKSKSQPTNSSSSKSSSRHTTATSPATSPAANNNNNNKNNNNNNNNNNNSTEINNNNNNNKTPIVSPDNNKANNNNNESRDECNTTRSNTSSRQPATSDMNNDNNNTKQSRSCRPDVPSTETGFFISRFDLVDDIAAAAADHRKNCPCDLIKTQRKSGFEVFFELECNFKGCKKKYHIRSGPGEPSKTKTPPATTEQQRRGAKVNQLNMIMTSAAHKSAIPTSHFLDFCHEVGFVSPSEKGLLKMMEKRKYAVKTVAEEVIRSNRREHVAMAKKIYGEDNVIKCKDADGMVHHFTRGAVCADGAGDKRAYNHRITGSMHSTVVFSMLTGKVIAVRHDQVSCGLCDRQLTKLLRLNKRADEITDDDLKHDGECSRNSKHNPAVAEEHACELIARDLLVDPATGKLRPDDEAILVDCFISDGDTKGAKRFIATQASIVPEFNGIAIYLPDIGHFIKCISNALHKLAGSNSTLRGVSLLEATRIKSICSDITGILKDYGRESKRIKSTLNNVCLSIASVIVMYFSTDFCSFLSAFASSRGTAAAAAPFLVVLASDMIKKSRGY